MNSKNSIGIDISNASIKVVEVDTERNIVAYGMHAIPEGVIADGVIAQEKKFGECIQEVLKQTVPHALYTESVPLKALVGIPESVLFTYELNVEKTTIKDVSVHIKNAAASVMPFDIEHMEWDYLITKDSVDDMEVVFYCVEKKIVGTYVATLLTANIEPIFLAGKLLSLGRAILRDVAKGSFVLIADIGAVRTHIGVFNDQSVLQQSSEVRLGGEAIRKHRTKNTKKAERISTSLEPIVSEITRMSSSFEREHGVPIDHILLAGGSTIIPEVSATIQKTFDTRVKLASIEESVQDVSIFIEKSDLVVYANTVGLALRGIDEKVPGINLLTKTVRKKNPYTIDIDITDSASIKAYIHTLVQRFTPSADASFVQLLLREKKLVLSAVLALVSVTFFIAAILLYL